MNEKDRFAAAAEIGASVGVLLPPPPQPPVLEGDDSVSLAAREYVAQVFAANAAATAALNAATLELRAGMVAAARRAAGQE